MADAVLFDVAAEILRKLTSRVLQEIGLWWGVQDELRKLESTVSTIQAVLLDAEEKSSESQQVKNWLGKLKEAVYDADDLLDDFHTEASRRQFMAGNRIGKEVRLFFSSSNQLTYGYKMGRKIRDVRGRLEEINKEKNFHLEEIHREEKFVMGREREQTHSSPPAIVVGRDNDKKAIVDLLLSSNCEENVSIISIVGIGGLGKTTLAQHVYQDERVEAHFDVRIWVCVAENFDVKLIVQKILESEKKNKCEDMEMDALKYHLHDKINGRRYLLVLDDVWNNDLNKWSPLKDLLTGGARGSRIIVTTWLRKTAEFMGTPYELGGLPETESWDLLKQIAFKRGEVPSPIHEAIGREIVKKRAGVPLAVRTIGSILYFKNTESEWLVFKDMEISKLDQTENNILPSLKLSYSHLPSYLKHCFAYCRLFPKDFVINVEMLIQLWVAQGYVRSSRPFQSLELIGREYFMDLLWRSFFIEGRRNESGNVVTCKMHDLMHDLASLVAGHECTSLDSDVSYVDENTRHVSLSNFNIDSQWQGWPSFLKASKMRTFLVLDDDCKIAESDFYSLLSNLKCLRLLKVYRLKIQSLPRSIGKLKHLRHLDLSRNDSIEVLPDSITKLQNLQVLKLNWCVNLKQLPKDIKNLVNLVELGINRCDSLCSMPPGIGQLTSLQKLSRFVLAKDNILSKRNSGLHELRDLNLTGELTLTNLRYVKNAATDCKAVNLKEKQHLQRLQFEFATSMVDVSANDIQHDELVLENLLPHVSLQELFVYRYRGLKLPNWFSSLKNLGSINLNNCIKCQCLPPLDQFPSLKSLAIVVANDLEYIDYDIKQGPVPFFPSLERLFFRNCPKLKGWRRRMTAGMPSTPQLPATFEAELPQFHCLSFLGIFSCGNLTSMPHFPPLRTLSLGGSNLKSMEQILKFTVSTVPSSSSLLSVALSQLKFLTIEGAEDLEFLPEDLLKNLASLVKLNIVSCPKMITLPQEIGVRTSLRYLEIYHCEQLEVSDGVEWQNLRSLRGVGFRDLPKLVSLPAGLQHVTSLNSLSIDRCDNLASLPEWMCKLTTLQRLIISDCSQLSERCRKNTGEDWPKIAHIPYVKIR